MRPSQVVHSLPHAQAQEARVLQEEAKRQADLANTAAQSIGLPSRAMLEVGRLAGGSCSQDLHVGARAQLSHPLQLRLHAAGAV